MTVISYVKRPSLRLPEDRGHSAAVATTTTGPVYSLRLANESDAPWFFYVYQQLPGQTFSLAWFVSPFPIVPSATITFEWTKDYFFFWGASREVKPGVVFSPIETVPADPQAANTTNFSPSAHLLPAVAGKPQGSLVIQDAVDCPPMGLSVGIGMGDAGTFIAEAGPNLLHMFTPPADYWIAAGTNVQVGTILDVVTVTQNAQVIFPVNVYSAGYKLGPGNEWAPS